VVELSWMRDDGAWSRVPSSHLVATGEATAVPEPGTGVMTLTGLLALGTVLIAHPAPACPSQGV
jgi:hypothetical protein